MKERKFIKVRTDMYSDTKFKIIDTMEDRDVIHYIWTRLLTLAGKVNLEGTLYMSRSIPYTIETLAIEFNRSINKVKLALKVFKDLEMIELDENNVYKVKNFAKYQNIKSKENSEKDDGEKKSIDKRNIEKLAHKKNLENKNKGNDVIIRRNFNTKNCKSEFNDDKNFINDNCQKDKVNFEESYKESEKFNKHLLKNKVNGEVKNEEYKAKEIKDFKNNERAKYKDNNLYIDNEKERKASLKDTNKKEQNKNLCKNKLKNDKSKVKEFKSTNKTESYGNNESIVNKNNSEKANILLNCSNETTKKESKDIDFNINLGCNNNKKKPKKSRKKSEEIEELCFEENMEDIIAPMEYNDEPILNGKVIKEFSF